MASPLWQESFTGKGGASGTARGKRSCQGAKVRELESALAQSQVKLFAYESLVDVAEEHYGADFKKNFGAKRSAGVSSNGKKQGSK
jgi:hypothetical protein